MKKKNRKFLYAATFCLTAFVIWTALVYFIDVKAIGPQGTRVGLATINKFVHNLFGVHMSLYTITDWLGLVPIAFVLGFALLGLVQWIKRKNIKKVDRSILLLGGYYIVVMSVYILFEYMVINYRPILISGILEASYPSSTTMLVLCVMPSAIIQFNRRIQNNLVKHGISLLIQLFTIFMTIGRLVSGVHWFSDIIGGILLSVGLVASYCFILTKIE